MITQFRIYAAIALSIIILALGGWGALGWSMKDAAQARADMIEAENTKLINDLITERENVLTAYKLASAARQAAADANARAEEIRKDANEMIEAFRLEETQPEPEPVEVAVNEPPRPRCTGSYLSDSDRARLLKDIPIVRARVGTDPRTGQFRGSAVPGSGSGPQPESRPRPTS